MYKSGKKGKKKAAASSSATSTAFSAEMIETSCAQLKMTQFQVSQREWIAVAKRERHTLIKKVAYMPRWRQHEAVFLLNVIHSQGAGVAQLRNEFNKFYKFTVRHKDKPYPPLIRNPIYVPYEDTDEPVEADKTDEEERQQLTEDAKRIDKSTPGIRIPFSPEELKELVDEDTAFLNTINAPGNEGVCSPVRFSPDPKAWDEWLSPDCNSASV